MKDRDYNPIGKRINQILSIFAIILMTFILIIPEVISILAPPSYSEAIGILPALVLSVFFQLLFGFFGCIDFYFEQSVFPMIASVVAALTNLILNYYCIPAFGYYAAGYTTLISFVIMSIMHYIFMRIVLNKNNIHHRIFDIKKIAIISFLVVTIGFCELLLYDKIVIRYIIASIVFMGMFYMRKKIVSILRG